MTQIHYNNLLKAYKEVLLTRDINNIGALIKDAILERDLCLVTNESTDDVNDYIIELRYLQGYINDFCITND